ncbi:CPBP family intramembrane metalloprotease [candidate division KSB1 bacterium]|nr:CPBP family intramembrane metalloprotease [candidate division KSB1 bacterium]
MESKAQFLPNLSDVFLVLILTIFFPIILSLLGIMLLDFDARLFQEKYFQVLELVVFFPMLLYILFKRYPFFPVLRIRKIPLRILSLTLVIGLSMVILTTELDYLISLYFPIPPEVLNLIEDFIKADNWLDWVWMVLFAVIVAGLFEEMLFRGFVQQGLERSKLQIPGAIIITSIFFMFCHIPWWWIQTLLFAAILGVMAWRSNSILPGAIIHALNNGISILFSNQEPQQYRWLMPEKHIAPAWLILAAISFGWAFLKFYQYYAATAMNSGRDDTSILNGAATEDAESVWYKTTDLADR